MFLFLQNISSKNIIAVSKTIYSFGVQDNDDVQ